MGRTVYMDRLLRKRKSWVSSERSWSAGTLSWEAAEGRFMASSSMSAIVEVLILMVCS